VPSPVASSDEQLRQKLLPIHGHSYAAARLTLTGQERTTDLGETSFVS